MAAQKRAQQEKAAPSLPEITVGKFEDAAMLVESLVAEKASVFVDAIARYRDTHREGTTRPLNHEEAAQIAVAMVDALPEDRQGDLGQAAADLQQSELRAYDQPDQREVLVAAGFATAPAFIDASRRVVALIEMPKDEYEQACQADNLDGKVEERALALRSLELGEGRERASAALAHFAVAAGVGQGSGEAWAHIATTVLKALEQAVGASFPASSTSSLVNTGGEPTGSDTGSPGLTPTPT